MTGTIEIKKLNLMGYTPETQVWVIQNAGGQDTFHFLQRHAKHFDHSLFCGQTYNTLPASRIEKFRAYAESKGFEVRTGGYL